MTSCKGCNREFSVFIRPYSCELCNAKNLCSNCARKFVLSYEPNPSYLRLCNKCCTAVSKGNQLNHSSKLTKSKSNGIWPFTSFFGTGSSTKYKQQQREQSLSKSINNLSSQNISLDSPPKQSSCTYYYCCSTQNNKYKHNNNDNKCIEGINTLKNQGIATFMYRYRFIIIISHHIYIYLLQLRYFPKIIIYQHLKEKKQPRNWFYSIGN